MKKYFKLTREGFTLVELMIVVAIIGVLASIAVPQYSKFQAKSRQAEVKIQLGAAHTVERSYATDSSTYTSCLGQVGYNRDGTKFYYAIGWAASAGTGCIPGGGGGSCEVYQWSYIPGSGGGSGSYTAVSTCSGGQEGSTMFSANVAEPGRTVPAATGSAVTSSTFVIGAVGNILSSGASTDTWTVDQNKQMLNTISGLK